MRVVAKGAAQRRTEEPGPIDELPTETIGAGPKPAKAPTKARGILSAAKNAAATVRKSGKGKADEADAAHRDRQRQGFATAPQRRQAG